MELTIWERVKDILFPRIRCMLCDGAAGVTDGVCAACRVELEENRYPLEEACPFCGEGYPATEVCVDCSAQRPSFAAARSLYYFHAQARELVHQLKFRGEYDLAARFFAPRVAEAVHRLRWEPELVLGVPVTRKGLRKRGYNQTEVLAKRVGKALGIPVARRALRKRAGTHTQVGLRRNDRLHNLKNNILPGRNADLVRGKIVLLLDDVYTTGSTVRVCSEALLALGAKAVYVLTLTRVGAGDVERYIREREA